MVLAWRRRVVGVFLWGGWGCGHARVVVVGGWFGVVVFGVFVGFVGCGVGLGAFRVVVVWVGG